MAKYIVTGLVTISVRVQVDADSEESARKAAEDMPLQRFCDQCSTGDPEAWSAEELDGEVVIQEARISKRKAGRHG